MNNWQNWAVALILLLCIVRIGQSVYLFFRKVKENVILVRIVQLAVN